MPEFPLLPASNPVPLITQVSQAKKEVSQYADIIREVNSFANSDVGKLLINKFGGNLQPKVVGNPQPGQGDNKPMPQDPALNNPFYAGNGPAPRNGQIPASQSPPSIQVVEKIVQVPVQPTPDQLYDASLSGLMQLSDFIGKEKTLEEAIEWVRNNKMLVMASFSIKK